MSQRLEVWCRFTASIRVQVHVMANRREIHDGLREMLEVQADPEAGYFWDAFHGMYIESQSLAVRRQADTSKQALSLRRLIGQLQSVSSEFTRTWFIDRWLVGFDDIQRDLQRDIADRVFDKFTDSPGEAALGKGRLARDLEELRDRTDGVVRFVNENVAHTDGDPSLPQVTYGEFDAAVAHIEELMKRYVGLIEQVAVLRSTPTMQADWRSPFRRPLAQPLPDP